MSISHENGQISLYDVACFYVNQGWSVIPLCGDSRPDRPKSPLISWKVYQQKTAATHEIAGWFEELPVGALGIVCGAVSRLLVLDFDDSDMADAFARMLPDLTRTFTVRSGKRGLPHYYYRVASGTELFSKHFSGVDLLWNGTYVVAPPSVIADSAWKVVCDVHPVELSYHDVARIQAFLEAYAYQADERNTVKEALSLFERQVSGSLGTDRYSDAAMCRWYGELAVSHGRNEALFRVACLMRDLGRSRDAIVEVLEPLHAMQPALGPHHAETVEQRRREAVRTIYSVFARPPRVRSFVTSTGGLPNTAREALLKQGLVSVARVVDGLLLLGSELDQVVTESDLCELLQPCGIGRRTVQNALKAVLESGESIFQDLGKGFEAPLDPPIQPHAYAETHPKIDRTKCFFVRVTKRVRTGCPPTWYKVPTVSALCRMLKVSASSSDALTRDDLANAKTYRMALQRQLFRRRPGQYSRRWLAQRLGITIRTCQRYDHDAGYSARPMFRETLMTWGDARALPGAVRSELGTFLETGDGKRYPAIRSVAMRLLHQKKRLVLKYQCWNFYAIEQMIEKWPQIEVCCDAIAQDNQNPGVTECENIHNNGVKPDQISTPTPSLAPEPAELEAEKHFWLCDQCLNWHVRSEEPGCCRRCGEKHWRIIPAQIWQDVKSCKQWWQSLKKARKLEKSSQLSPSSTANAPQTEDAAERLYRVVYERDSAHSLTRGRTKALVEEYGAEQVEGALAALESLRDVHNPAGFIIAHLRREKEKAEAGEWKPITLADIRRSMLETHRIFVEELRASPYAKLFAGTPQFVPQT